MADTPGGSHRSTTWSSTSQHAPSSIPGNRLIATASLPSLSHEHEKALSESKSRRTHRRSGSMIPEMKAYPLPDPSQFENRSSYVAPLPSTSSSPFDPTDDILYPMQLYKRMAEKERETVKSSPPVVTPVVTGPEDEKQAASVLAGPKLPSPPDKVPAAVMETVLESLPEEVPAKGIRSKVVIVHNAEKKFTTGALDVALREFAVAEGDAVVVVAFLEHIMSPLGMKMVADLEQFRGVNQSIIKKSVLETRGAIESKLRDTHRSRLCEKKIQLLVKVLPGSNPKALVAKEIIDLQATCVIFDTNAMKNRKYYENNLSCQIFRLRSDGARVETISLFGQGAVDKTGCTLAHSSDSSSESGSMYSDSPTIWSKLFGSRRSTGSRHHNPASVTSISRTSSNRLGSSKSAVQEGIWAAVEVLEESFSFDSPKPNPAAEAYVYEAAGFEHKFSSFARNRNGESNKLPTALAA